MDSVSVRKPVLVTGAGQRIGNGIATHLAEKGWDVAIHYNRSEKDAAELAQILIRKFPDGRFETFRADLTDTRETEMLIGRVAAVMGKPEILVNNASVFEPASIRNSTPQFFDRQIAVNFRAPFILIREFARLCEKGLIINMVDTRITGNQPGYAAYTLSKKALWELTKMAALELAPGFRVNAIAPGLALPPAGEDERYLLRLSVRIPMKKPGGLIPILKSVDFILENEYLTGQLLYCDGGENLGTLALTKQE
jgi:NAD(P)-dependent dehydrogenase (short-subunit alcohol dehydrogenase family)